MPYYQEEKSDPYQNAMIAAKRLSWTVLLGAAAYFGKTTYDEVSTSVSQFKENRPSLTEMTVTEQAVQATDTLSLQTSPIAFGKPQP